jgi:SAM-dependent methyltransferase
MASGALTVDPRNAEQARAWDGDEGAYWAAHSERFDAAMRGYRRPFLDAAAIAPGEQVLDIGCGTGQSARDAARRAHPGWVLGLDLSSAMLEVARRAAEREGVSNVRFERADAQVHPLPADAFDVAVSRAGAMFFADPVAAFANVLRALRPGGRLVLLIWQAPPRNEWFTEFAAAFAAGRVPPGPPPAAPGPFSLADPARARAVLSAAGFTATTLDDVRAPMYFGDVAAAALAFVEGLFGWMLDGLDADGRERARANLRDSLDRHTTAEGVWYGSAAWLVGARRG